MTPSKTIPPGEYTVVIASVHERQPLYPTIHPTYEVALVVIEGEHIGHVIGQFWSESPNARWVWDHVVDEPTDARGLRARARVDTDEWNGKRRNRPGQLKPLEDDLPLERKIEILFARVEALEDYVEER